MKNSFIYTVIFTFILCFLFVLILSFTNAVTVDKIEANIKFEKEQAILRALGVTDIDTKEQVDAKFANITQRSFNDTVYYQSQFQGKTIYASQYSGPGLWGTIAGYIAMDEDVTQLVGFSITSQNETPGLGARISEPWFAQQMVNEKIVNNNVRVGSGGTGDADKNNGIIDGITGATRTSEGVQSILQNAINKFRKDLGR